MYFTLQLLLFITLVYTNMFTIIDMQSPIKPENIYRENFKQAVVCLKITRVFFIFLRCYKLP